MQYRELGQTEITPSVISLGTWQFAGGDDLTWSGQEDRDSTATIHAALDAGITFFDTAEGYGHGHAEEVLGKALKGVRDEIVIASKAGSNHLAPDALREACHASLRRLRTDYIDLYQIHWPSRTVPLRDSLQALGTLRKEGKIRTIGVSNFGRDDLRELLQVGSCVTNQIAYSLLWRAVEYEIQPICEANGIGMLSYSSLMQGLLTGKFEAPEAVPDGRARTRLFSSERPHARHGETGCETEVFKAIHAVRAVARREGMPMATLALAWLTHRPAMAAVVVGARAPGQVRDLAGAGDVTLRDDVVRELDAITDPVKTRMGTNADMWQSQSRMR